MSSLAYSGQKSNMHLWDYRSQDGTCVQFPWFALELMHVC